MSKLSLLSLSAISATLVLSPAMATELVIGAGQVYQARSDLHLDRLVMEDGAKLVAPAGALEWIIHVNSATLIGKSYISAKGASGAIGGDGSSASGTAETCKSGDSGGTGTHGGSGQSGTTIHATFGIAQFNHLEINSTGGNGGVGGLGGNGSNGGKARGCNAGDGGEGGRGGDGGSGGQGGDITFSYWLTNSTATVPITNYGEGLILKSTGGVGGIGGVGGSGGTGGKLKFEKRPGGITVTRKGGDKGQMGNSGNQGGSGTDGRFRILTVVPPT